MQSAKPGDINDSLLAITQALVQLHLAFDVAYERIEQLQHVNLHVAQMHGSGGQGRI